MIEQILTDLISEIKGLRAEIRNLRIESTPQKVEEQPATNTATTTPPEDQPTLDDVRQALLPLEKATAKQILADHKVQKLSELNASQYTTVITAAKQVA